MQFKQWSPRNHPPFYDRRPYLYSDNMATIYNVLSKHRRILTTDQYAIRKKNISLCHYYSCNKTQRTLRHVYSASAELANY